MLTRIPGVVIVFAACMANCQSQWRHSTPRHQIFKCHDIQPILAEHCLQCHGMDAADRKSGLRLDLRDAALKGGESGSLRRSCPANWNRAN